MIKKSAISAVIVLTFLIVGSSAQTAGPRRPFSCPKEPEDDAAAIALAGELFDKGEQLIDRKKYHRALKKFMCSAEIRDHVNTTFNIAQAARLFKKKRKVRKYFKYFIKANPDTITAKELTKIVTYIEEN